jgi:hypothetical protein
VSTSKSASGLGFLRASEPASVHAERSNATVMMIRLEDKLIKGAEREHGKRSGLDNEPNKNLFVTSCGHETRLRVQMSDLAVAAWPSTRRVGIGVGRASKLM